MTKEILTNKTKMTKLSVTNNEISAILKSEDVKTGLRLYSDGYVGIAGAIGKYDEGELIRQAGDMLRYQVPYACGPTVNAIRTMDFSGQQELSDEEFIEISTRLLDALKTRYPSFSYSHIIRYVEKETSLRNDRGTDLTYKDKYFSLELLIKHKSSKNLMDNYAVNQSRLYSFDDAYSIASEFCDAYEEKVDLDKECKMPVVVLTEHELFLGKFYTDLHGKQYGTNTSLFSDKTGEKLFNEQFSLQVNRNPLDTYSCFFDGEGTMPENSTGMPGNNAGMLIENGVLKMPYSTKRIARKYNLPLTSSASLTYDAVPDAVTDGISIVPGGQTLRQLLQGRKAIYVIIASGGDFTAQGEFATPVQAAYLFDGDKIYGRLPQLVLTGSVYDMFGKDFIGVSADGNSKYNPFKYLVMDMNVRKIGEHL